MVCGKEAQYSEIIATSANQIVPPVQKYLLYSPDHLSFLEEEEVCRAINISLLLGRGTVLLPSICCH